MSCPRLRSHPRVLNGGTGPCFSSPSWAQGGVGACRCEEAEGRAMPAV